MNNHGWSVSISLLLLWLLCQCGNGIGDDATAIIAGGSGITEENRGGNKSIILVEQSPSPVVKIPSSTTTTASTTTFTSTSTNISKTTLLSADGATTSSSFSSTSNSSSSGLGGIILSTTTTAAASSFSIESTTSSSKILNESKFSQQNNGTSPSLLRGSQLKNDNETVRNALQSTQPSSPTSTLSPSTTTVTTPNLASSSSSTSSSTSTAYSSPPSYSFTTIPNIHHRFEENGSTAFSEEQHKQQQQQQRSKLWAPHSNVADFLKAMDEDGGTNLTESHSTSNSSGNGGKSNTNVVSEKVGQQTRSIRSIRLIANNNSSGSSTAGSTLFSHHRESQQARAGEEKGDGPFSSKMFDESEGNDVGDNEDGDVSDVVFHVNSNKFPVISSIRHYRSRKSFSRTRKSTNSNGDAGGATAGSGSVIRDDSVSTFTSAHREKLARKLKNAKTFASKLSFSRQTMGEGKENDENGNKRGEEDNDFNKEETKDTYETPQGDEPQRGEEEGNEDDEAIHSRRGYYYGRVASRRNMQHNEQSEEKFQTDAAATGRSQPDSSSGGSGEHYGKVMDKPHVIASNSEGGQKSGYSSSDDTAATAVYEKSYFIPQDVSSSSSETTGDSREAQRNGRKRPGQPSSKNANNNAPSHHFGRDEVKNSTILQKINKTFLSRSRSRQQQQQLEQLELEGSESDHEMNISPVNSLNADLLRDKEPNLNSAPHWPNIITGQAHSSPDKLHQENAESALSGNNGEHKNSKGALASTYGNVDSSRGINSHSSASTSTSGTINNNSPNNLRSQPGVSSSFFGAATTANNMVSRDKLQGSLNDSDYVVVESGKSHSLLEEERNLSNERDSVDSRGKNNKQSRNRNNGGQYRSRNRQNKERRRQKGSRGGESDRDLASVPNDPRKENGSGSLSDTNNFHASQDPQGRRGRNHGKDDAWTYEHNKNFDQFSPSDENRDEGYPARSPKKWEDKSQSRVRPTEVLRSSAQGNRHVQQHQRQQQQQQRQSLNSLPINAKEDKRRSEHDRLELDYGRSIKSERRGRGRKGKNESNSEESDQQRNSPTIEYFPRVGSFSDSSVGDSSSSNLFDEYRPLGPDYYGSDSSDLSLDDGSENVALSDFEIPSSQTSSATSPRNRPDSDIVTRFLNIVESSQLLGENCTAGTEFHLGEGVVDRYAQERFRLEAEFAVNRANMLTRMWKYVNISVLHNEYLLHAMVMSMVEFDDDIFAGGNCYDEFQYKNYTLFCPFAFRYDGGTVMVKDLSLEYNYLGNSSEFFYQAKKNAGKIVQAYNQFNRGFHQFRINETSKTDPIPDEVLNVTYEDGKWSKPYFDCGGANIWMITYTVPFFGYDNTTGKYFFKGTSGIDIDLRRVDIDQCPLPENSTELNIFAGSDKCKNATTMCVAVTGLGFRRGSYRCACKDGFYFPNVTASHKYYNGTVLEEEYEKKSDSNDTNYYDVEGAFECLRCAAGCDTCEDDRPCVVSLNWLMRSAILILQCAIILMLPIVGLFTLKYSEVKVVRAASPVLLRFIVLGAFFIYCTILVMYPSPSVITCTLRVWLREIGFSLAYGALMLKTWRISVIFRVRSAKAIKITDLDLMKRLGIIVAMFTALLVIRTLVAPPAAIVSLTADDLKAWLCKTDWWDHSFTLMELSFLVWGIRLCIVVRKAPSEFNESKFISLAIYNEFLLSLFLNISMLFLQSPANPDLLYIIFFCHVQLTMTLLLCLIFGSKAYMVFRGQGKGGSDESSRMPTSKFISKSRSGPGNKQLSAHNSTGFHSSNTSTGHDPNYNSRLSEDVQEEFRRLYGQLEELKERNMRLGNRHLVAKITAMQEAADNILQAPVGQINGQSHTATMMQQQLHQLSPGNNSGGGGGSGGNSPSSSATCTSSHSPHTKGKSPSAHGPLSDISEEENPLQSLSGGQVQSPGIAGPKVLETSIDIVIQSDASRKTATAPELGDNDQAEENNLNNGFHPLAQGLTGEVEDSGKASSEGITCSKKENNGGGGDSLMEASQSCQSTSKSSSESVPDVPLKDQKHDNDRSSGAEVKVAAGKGKSVSEAVVALNHPLMNTSTQPKDAKAAFFNSPPASSSSSARPPSSSSTEKQHSRQKKAGGRSPSNSPSKHQSGKGGEGKVVNHKDAVTGSSSNTSGGNGGGSSQKIILDLDDKSRFTEEITV